MKLHLPKLLRVALLCVVCGVSAATAADLSPDIKDVAPNGVSYQYYDIGGGDFSKRPVEHIIEYNGDITLNSGDKLGWFRNGEFMTYENGSQTTARRVIQMRLNPETGNYEEVGAYYEYVTGSTKAKEFSNVLTINGKLAINDDAQVSIGGQYKVLTYREDIVDNDGRVLQEGTEESYSDASRMDDYSYLVADEVEVTGTGSGLHLQLTAAKLGKLTVNSGNVELHKDQYGTNNSGQITSGNMSGTSFKYVQITDSLEQNGGSLLMGRRGTKSKIESGKYGTALGNYDSPISITQTAGTTEILGNTLVLSALTINQSGSNSKLEIEDVIYFNTSESHTISQQSGTMLLGQLESTKGSEFSIMQTGAGSITLAYGAKLGRRRLTDGSYENSTIDITQTGGGTITIGGGNGVVGASYYLKSFAHTYTTYNINQSSGKIVLSNGCSANPSADAKITAGISSIGDKMQIQSETTFATKKLEVYDKSSIENKGKMAVGTRVPNEASVGSLFITSQSKVNFFTTETSDDEAPITLTGAMNVAADSSFELYFCDSYLVNKSDTLNFKLLVANGVTETSLSDAALKIGNIAWQGSDLKWTVDGEKVYVEGTLNRVNADSYTTESEWIVDALTDGKKTDGSPKPAKLIITSDTTIKSANEHTGGTEISGADVVLANAGALGSGMLETSDKSSLVTEEGTVANLPSTISNSGTLTLGGDYSAESGKLAASGSEADYLCVESKVGNNGFATEGTALQVVKNTGSGSVEVLPSTTLTVGTDKYLVSDEGSAWQLDCSTYYINEDGHEVKMSDIKDVATTMNPSNGTPDVKMKGGKLTVDEGEVTVTATSGGLLMKGDVKVKGELSGDTTVAVLEGEAELKGNNTHTGGVYVDGATLEVGEEKALGEGIVYLENQGKLDLNRYAVQNDIVVTGCELHNALNYQGNLTVSGNLTICGSNANANELTLSGAGNIKPSATETLTVNSLVVAADATSDEQLQVATTVNESIVLYGGAVLTMKDKLTLADGTVIVLHGAYQGGDTLITLDDAGDINKTSGSVTLDNGYGAYELQGTKVVLTGIFDQTIADAMAQANWGIPTASRAFVHAIRGQRTNTGCIANGRGTAWAAVLGAYNELDGGDVNLKGAAVGADMKVGRCSSVGMALGYLDGEVSPTGLSEVDQEGTYVALYGEHGLRKLSATSCLSADWVVAYGQTESKYKGMSWEQDSLQLNGRLSWNKQLSERLGLRVFGGLEYFTSDSGKVNGIDTGSIDNLRGELGVGADYVAWGIPADEKSGNPGCRRLVLHGELRYFNDLDRENPVVRMDGLSGRGENPGRSGVGVDMGATYRINDRWSTSANYSYSSMDGSTEHRVNVGASYTF